MKTTTLIIGVLMLGATTSAAAGDSPFFERLGEDLAATDVVTVGDLNGPELEAFLERGRLAVLKVSDEDLLGDGFVADVGDSAIRAAIRSLDRYDIGYWTRADLDSSWRGARLSSQKGLSEQSLALAVLASCQTAPSTRGARLVLEEAARRPDDAAGGDGHADQAGGLAQRFAVGLHSWIAHAQHAHSLGLRRPGFLRVLQGQGRVGYR